MNYKLYASVCGHTHDSYVKDLRKLATLLNLFLDQCLQLDVIDTNKIAHFFLVHYPNGDQQRRLGLLKQGITIFTTT